MINTGLTPEEYIANCPAERKQKLNELRSIIITNLPAGFQEQMSYGMIGYVVPHTIYPAGYHCNAKLPLPFLAFASQKNFVSIYHMGVYAQPELLNWFVATYNAVCSKKLDMGKSCIRFKKMEDIPINLIGELVSKMSVNEWVELYEKSFVKNKK